MYHFLNASESDDESEENTFTLQTNSWSVRHLAANKNKLWTDDFKYLLLQIRIIYYKRYYTLNYVHVFHNEITCKAYNLLC